MTKESTETINGIIERTPNFAKMLNNFEQMGATLEGINKEGKIQFKYNPKREFCDSIKRQRASTHLKKITGFEVVFKMN